mgnify:CR=1 FL=1
MAKSKKAAEKKIVNQNVWLCCDKTFSQPEIVEHLKTVHNVQQPINGTRSMITHLDGREYFESHYKWKVGELVLHQSVRMERAADDIMRYI